jgi:glycine/D-amino acid oxidase-like deaminating enzyme
MGGGDVRYFYGSRIAPVQDRSPFTFDQLAEFLRTLFPSLREARISHQWGGPVSAPIDLVPTMGTLGRSNRAVFSIGPLGHGVAYTQLAGRVVSDLVLERESELTELFFVNRFTTPIPPEPLRSAIVGSILGGMRVHDRFCERGVFEASMEAS